MSRPAAIPPADPAPRPGFPGARPPLARELELGATDGFTLAEEAV